MYLEEVLRQCRYAINAALGYNKVLTRLHQRDDERDHDTQQRLHDEVFRSVHSLLTHSSNVSKLLWPPSKSKKPRARGRRLRELLHVDESSPLKKRSLRNHLEHFDERLDSWVESSEGSIVKDFIGPYSAIEGVPITAVYRWVNPERSEFRFRDEDYDLNELVAGVEELMANVPDAEAEIRERLIRQARNTTGPETEP